MLARSVNVARPVAKGSAPAARPRASVRAAAFKTRFDAEKLTADLQDKFEKTDKKAAVIGYSVAGTIAFVLAEKIIHAPLLSLLLGEPLEIIGLFTAIYLALRYVKDEVDPMDDAEKIAGDVVGVLPGLKKE
ncbi:unnamed protein product [Pedinophyceae sp. YPF-701]|nr:unnamed protein product [Pedinophyceae sp. YPF-701]